MLEEIGISKGSPIRAVNEFRFKKWLNTDQGKCQIVTLTILPIELVEELWYFTAIMTFKIYAPWCRVFNKCVIRLPNESLSQIIDNELLILFGVSASSKRSSFPLEWWEARNYNVVISLPSDNISYIPTMSRLAMEHSFHQIMVLCTMPSCLRCFQDENILQIIVCWKLSSGSSTSRKSWIVAGQAQRSRYGERSFRRSSYMCTETDPVDPQDRIPGTNWDQPTEFSGHLSLLLQCCIPASLSALANVAARVYL